METNTKGVEDGMAMTEEEFEFRQSWSMKAGEVSGLQAGVTMLEQAAASEFTHGKDDSAMYLRELRDRLKKLHTEASSKLQEYIKRGSK